MANNEKIILGSGKLYITEFAGATIPEDTVLEAESNLIGFISGGATLTYAPEFYTVKDDLNLVSRKFLTNEDVTFTSGVLTWNGETLEKLCSTAQVTESDDMRTVKIGGLGNYNGKSYVLHFVHKGVDGEIRITIVGSNEAGFEMAFAKDSETVVNAEFKAQPMDDNGTLVIYKESI